MENGAKCINENVMKSSGEPFKWLYFDKLYSIDQNVRLFSCIYLQYQRNTDPNYTQSHCNQSKINLTYWLWFIVHIRLCGFVHTLEPLSLSLSSPPYSIRLWLDWFSLTTITTTTFNNNKLHTPIIFIPVQVIRWRSKIDDTIFDYIIRYVCVYCALNACIWPRLLFR